MGDRGSSGEGPSVASGEGPSVASGEAYDPLTYGARSSPDSQALIDADAEIEWRYDELERKVKTLAGRLRAAGVERGDQVGALLEARVPFVLIAHATFRLGAVLVPLNPRLVQAELLEQRGTVDLSILVCDDGNRENATAIAGGVPVFTIDERERTERQEQAIEQIDAEPASTFERSIDDPLLILFTSGTTGTPKGVVLTLGNVLASATASAFRLGVLPGDRWLSPLPTCHMGGLAPILRSAFYGTCVIVQEGFDAEGTALALEEYEATGVSLVPTALDRLIDHGFSSSESLRFVLVGGAPTPPESIERCARMEVPICPTYGSTETASQVATARPKEAVSHPDYVGRPLSVVELTIVDEDGDPLPADERGEIAVGGPTVSPGYYRDSDATARSFGPHGFRTGDLGTIDEDGRLRVFGRVDDRIVTGGESVHPGEISGALNEHPSVREVAVVGLDDPEWGQRVAALVVHEPGATLTDADLQKFIASRLAPFKRPKTIQLVEELPRTDSGTVDRGAVTERLRAHDN